ncbi:MAG: ribosomal-processing cysteine protease Prp [Lachnospiraceae bacterium]|nr:ribosomal-processing cysteine protease Prp [Lachnospiraceae bacterium]
MVVVSVIRRSGKYHKLSIRGHADYADFGNDIVCAAVSILTINTFNSIEEFTGDDIAVRSTEKGGRLELSFKDIPSHDAGLLIDSMLFGLKQISQQYGDSYVTVNIKEE